MNTIETTTVESAVAVDDFDTLVPPPPVANDVAEVAKPKRGRPRKVVSVVTESLSTDEVKTEKRKPGRPKKVVTALSLVKNEPEQDEAVEVQTVALKRGRPALELPERKAGRPVDAFSYLFRSVENDEELVVIVPFDKNGAEIENHRLHGVMMTRTQSHTLIRLHEGNGRKPSFVYTPFGAIYTRNSKRGRPPTKVKAVAEAAE